MLAIYRDLRLTRSTPRSRWTASTRRWSTRSAGSVQGLSKALVCTLFLGLCAASGSALMAQGESAAAAAEAKAEREAKLLRVANIRLDSWATTSARSALKSLLESENPEAQMALGRLLTQEKRYDEAVVYLQKAAEQLPTDPEPRLQLGKAQSLAGREAEARAAYIDALKLCRKAHRKEEKALEEGELISPAVLTSLGRAKLALGDLHGAVADLQTAVEQEPTDRDMRYWLANARLQVGDFEGALGDFTKVVEAQRELAYAYFYRALAASKVGRADLLINDLERFLAAAPAAPDADQAKVMLARLRR